MAITLFDATWGALTIKQCSSVDFAPGNNIVPGRSSGGVAPSAHYLMSAEPRGRFSTTDLATVLAAIDEVAGLSVSNGSIVLPWRVRASGGIYAGSASHVSLGGSTCYGTLLPQTLTAQQDQMAQLDLEAIFRSANGFSAPVGWSTGVSLSESSFVGTYRLGPTKLDGSEITGVVGIAVNFGITPEIQRTDGGTWPNAIFIPETLPYVDLTVRNEALVGAHGPLFKAGTSAVFSLVANAPGGTISPLTEADHITVTLDGGIKSIESISAQGNSTAEPTIRIYAKTITVATGVALEESGG